MTISLATLVVVLVLIAVRRIGSLRVAIWQAMLGGALVVLVTGEVTPVEAVRAIDLDVMIFLLGMFLVGQALTESGYLYTLAYDLFCRLHSADALVAAVIVVTGVASALLMNDTLAVVGTALVLRLAREHRLDSRLMLMALAFGVTTGFAAMFVLRDSVWRNGAQLSFWDFARVGVPLTLLQLPVYLLYLVCVY